MLLGLMKQFLSSCPSIPDPRGAQYVHTFPFGPPGLLWEVSAAGALGGRGAAGGADVGVINDAWVSLSLAIATTSDQTIVDP